MIVEPDSSGTAPLACTEILGQSMLDRTVQRLRRANADPITVLVDDRIDQFQIAVDQSHLIQLSWVRDAWVAAQEVIQVYHDLQVESTLFAASNVYAELDLAEAVHFHQERHEPVTRIRDDSGPLDSWIIASGEWSQSQDLRRALSGGHESWYVFGGYVNRLAHPRDLRRLVVDSFNSRCQVRPIAVERRPGVWIAEDAHVNPKARIVAPVFIGAGSKIEDQCLITRCSNVERNSEVDCGTVVEDSSVLSDSYVGIGLEITHSVVDGSTLYNLRHDVTVEIADHDLIRPRGLHPVLGPLSTYAPT
jgi:NDP-sugar pyrophosphorylase family protein